MYGVHPGGVLVAALGFGITRVFVGGTLQTEATLPYVLTGIVPLVVGLLVTVLGVALAVGAFPRDYVATVARWTVTGTVGMLLILLVTALGQMLQGTGGEVLDFSEVLIANVVLGGTVGGVLIGDRSARNRRKNREIRRQVNRALLLNRLLKHEVINAAAIVDGHAELIKDGTGARTESVSEIRAATDRIVATIGEVGTIVEGDDTSARVDAATILEREIAAIRSENPSPVIEVEGPTSGIEVEADHRLALVFRELLDNAVRHATDRVEVNLTRTAGTVEVSIADDGPGLPETQRELLLSGSFPQYDDPSAGFGLGIVRLLVTLYEGTITLDQGLGGEGQRVTVALPRTSVEPELTRAIGVTFPNLYRAIAAGIVAGVGMGVVAAVTTDFLPVVGSLYGVTDPIVGWITHLFHSVVFALLFAAGCSHPRLSFVAGDPLRSVLAGLVWGAVLWLMAAGVIMPLWLQGIGIQAPLPNLPTPGFTTHAVWGILLGGSYVSFGKVALDGLVPRSGPDANP